MSNWSAESSRQGREREAAAASSKRIPAGCVEFRIQVTGTCDESRDAKQFVRERVAEALKGLDGVELWSLTMVASKGEGSSVPAPAPSSAPTPAVLPKANIETTALPGPEYGPDKSGRQPV